MEQVQPSSTDGATVWSGNVVPLAEAKVNPAVRRSLFVLMPAIVSRATAGPRFNSLLLGIFAGIALTVAAVGVYGMLAYSVAARTREIGLRIALGANGTSVAMLIARDTFMLCLAGLALGLLAASGAARFLGGLLYQIQPSDPVTFASVALVLTVVSLLACYLPARHASRIDPITTLRHE